MKPYIIIGNLQVQPEGFRGVEYKEFEAKYKGVLIGVSLQDAWKIIQDHLKGNKEYIPPSDKKLHIKLKTK